MSCNVAQFLSEKAREQPDAPAVRAPCGRLAKGMIRYEELKFSELELEASSAGVYFKQIGIARGTRVLLMLKPGLDLIRIVFALFKIGAVPIVIDPGMGLNSFMRCVQHSQPTAIIGLPIANWLAKIYRSTFEAISIRVSVNRDLKKLFKNQSNAGSLSNVDSRADELAAILFTSGSTGPAKGVCYTHGIFSAQVDAIGSQYNINPGEIDLPMLPVFALFNPALGMCTVVPEMNPSRPAAVDPKKIVQAIQQNKVTNSFGSPALWIRIARYCEPRRIQFPSIRRILMAGAPVPSTLMQQMKSIIPNGEIHTPYGATEALPVSSISSRMILEETAILTFKGKGTCVGRPLPNVNVNIIQTKDNEIEFYNQVNELPAGKVGEIIVSGPLVTKAYDNLPDVDAYSKIHDGETKWHRMGDLGYLDEEGRIWFCGRKTERVITTRGTLYTECCEAIFNAHPHVFRSALIGLWDRIDDGQTPAIVIEPELGKFPRTKAAKNQFIDGLRILAQTNPVTKQITKFYFERRFPVDIRHNAKIHRMELAKRVSKKVINL